MGCGNFIDQLSRFFFPLLVYHTMRLQPPLHTADSLHINILFLFSRIIKNPWIREYDVGRKQQSPFG